jgi:hypothetical protein
MKRSKLLRDSIIVIAISLALLVVSEAMLRIVFPDKITDSNKSEAPNVPPPAFGFNEDYLVSLKPNRKKKFVRSEQDGGDIIQWDTNNNSFRGGNLKNNPKTRIIVYGDSNILARFSSDENTYVRKLEKYLNRNGLTDIEVVNAGIVGFGPDQSLIRFNKEADVYKPDLVIFHVFADNDFGDIVRNRLFELDVNGNLRETDYRKTDYRKTVDENVTVNKNQKQNDFISSLLIMRAAKKLIGLLEIGDERKKQLNILQNINAKEYSVYKKSQPRKSFPFADHYDIDIALDPDKESSKIKIKLMESVLKRANTIAGSKGIKFLVLIQPSKKDLTKDNAVLNYEYLQKYPKYRRTNLTDAVKNKCVENNIYFINLFDVFMRNNPENLYFRIDQMHWNDQGQDIAAKETALYITSFVEK